jgi:2-haloacid dehalogenase
VPVRNVVFDIGGVLLDWDPRHLYRSLIDDVDEMEWFLANVCTTAWNAELDGGRSFDEACDELAARHPDHAELVHAWKRQDEMVAGEVAGTAEIVRELRRRGVPLYLLTNMPADVYAARVSAYEVLQGFDGAVVSGHEGVMKPSPKVFRLLVERFGIEPAQTLFIDDSPGNVDGARAVGLHAHQFRDAPTLRAALGEQGLLE